MIATLDHDIADCKRTSHRHPDTRYAHAYAPEVLPIFWFDYLFISVLSLGMSRLLSSWGLVALEWVKPTTRNQIKRASIASPQTLNLTSFRWVGLNDSLFDLGMLQFPNFHGRKSGIRFLQLPKFVWHIQWFMNISCWSVGARLPSKESLLNSRWKRYLVVSAILQG